MGSALATRSRATWATGRRWTPVDRVPLPPREAGRAELVALLNGPGGPRDGLKTAWDDRAETSVKAVHRYLWRLAHAHKSGSFACSVDQLIVGLMGVMQWHDHGSRLQNRSAYSRSVRRWLDRLQAMGLLEWRGVRDNQDRWWRTEIRLLQAPQPDRETLRQARVRLRGFARRERRRRTRRPRRRRDLGIVLERSARPCARTRQHLGRRRGRAIQTARVAARAACPEQENVSPNLFEALASLEPTPNDSLPRERFEEPQRTTWSLVEIAQQDEIVGIKTGEALTSNSATPLSEANGNVSTEKAAPAVAGTVLAARQFEALAARVAAREQAIAEGREPPTCFHVIAATRRRAFETLESWPAGRRIPARLLAEAFEHATGGTEARLARDESRWRPMLDRALRMYARNAEQRPAGWPQAPEAALACVMRDVAGEAESAVYAIGRLRIVALQMRAAAKRTCLGKELAARAARADARERRRERARIPFRQTAGPLRAGMPEEPLRRLAMGLAARGELPGAEALFGFMVRGSDLLGRPHEATREDQRDALAYARRWLAHRDADHDDEASE